MVYTIYGHGRHLEFRIKITLAIFRSPSALGATYEIRLHLSQWFQRRSRLKVWTDDIRWTGDGGFSSYKLPQSLRLRGAKNSDKYREEISSRRLVYNQTILSLICIPNMTTLACMVVVKSLTKNLMGQTKGRTEGQTDVNQYTPPHAHTHLFKAGYNK